MDANVLEIYAQYGAVGVIIGLFAWSFVNSVKSNKNMLVMLNNLKEENEGQSRDISNIQGMCIKLIDRWNKSDDVRDRRHEDIAKKLDEQSDELNFIKGKLD